MNKFLFLLKTILVAAICSLNLVACSSDDDDDNDNSNSSSALVGNPTSAQEVSGNTWVLNKSKSSAFAEMNGIKGPSVIEGSQGDGIIPEAFTFNSDGTAEVLASGIKSNGNYSINGRQFSCSYKVLLNKTEWDENGTVESKVEKDFTLEKDFDITKLLYEDLGADSSPMTTTFTQCEISKLGSQLILNLTMTTKLNSDLDLSGAYEFGEQFGNLINNTAKSKKYIAYSLVYEKK